MTSAPRARCCGRCSSRSGYPISWKLGDSVAALEILGITRRDVVITDLLMHPMDGIEFIRTLRRPDGGPNRYVPVLMVSGHTELQQVKNALAAGVTDFLAKPISPAALRLRLQTIVDKPKARVQANDYAGPDRRRQAARAPDSRRQSDKS
jgi:two-component system chemotaxis response regulator CheY